MADAATKAVVLVSGGLDSATTLAIARELGYACHALSFDYGQRHRVELEAAKNVAQSLNAVEHKIMTLDLRAFGGSALTDDIDVPKDRPPHRIAPNTRSPAVPLGGGGSEEIPITYVPARNTIFLSYALAYAEVIDSGDIFIGVNAVDYSGYPDCRPEYVRAFERMANLATKRGVEGGRVTIHTPLIDMTKAQIITRGIELGVEYGLTLSCYDPDEQGRPCGQCDSCLLRAVGFREAGLEDPAVVGD
jgi:7-cyano-7-deazaguanine synthase